MLSLASLCSSLIQFKIVVGLLLLLIKDNYLCHTFVCTKLLQVIIKGFTWVVLVEKPSLEAHKNSISSSSLPYSFTHSSQLVFQLIVSVRQVKIIFYKSYLLAGKFLCLHRNFLSLSWCFAAYISKVLLADTTGQRHIFEEFAAQSTREASRLTFLKLG